MGNLKDSLRKIASNKPGMKKHLGTIFEYLEIKEKTAAKQKDEDPLRKLAKRKEEVKGRRIFSRKAYRKLRKEVGRRTTGFFRLYKDLRRFYQGVKQPPEEGLKEKFREEFRILLKKISDKNLKQILRKQTKELKRYFQRLDKQRDITENNPRVRKYYKKIIRIYSDIIKKVGKENGVYLETQKLRRPGWIRFEMMKQKEKRLEKYKEMDEELYEKEKEKQELQEKIREGIKDDIQQAGYETEKMMIMNKPVITGKDKGDSLNGAGQKVASNAWKIDPETSKRIDLREYGGKSTEIKVIIDGNEYIVNDYHRDQDGHVVVETYNDIKEDSGSCQVQQDERWVFDEDGNSYPVEEYKERRKEELESYERLSKVFPDEEELGEMRTYGTEDHGKGRRGDIANHGMGQKVWVFRDKDPQSFRPENLKGHEDVDLQLHINDEDYDIIEWGTHTKDGEEFLHVYVDRQIDNKKYGSYAIQEKENIVDEFKENQEVEYRALTDDSEKQNNMTRIYPTIDIHGQTVICEGRYKGMLLDDMINQAGRMIEGVSYDYDPDVGRPVRLDNVEEDELREPYISLTEDDELLLRIPSRNNYTDMRNRVREMAESVPEIEYIEETRQSHYVFEPDHFRTIRDLVRTLSMTNAAREKIQAYFEKLREEQSVADNERIEHFSADSMGGFTEEFEFRQKQKEAVAWLDGDSGLIAAETGAGKCVHPETRVDTNRGMVQIKDLDPGINQPDTSQTLKEDWKVFVNGEYLPVKRFYYGGEEETRRVTTKKGFSVEGTTNHPLLTIKEGEIKFEKTENLQQGDWVAIHRSKGGFAKENHKLNHPDPEDFHYNTEIYDLPNRMTPELGRLFAYIIAEGWTNIDDRIMISQSKKENPVMEKDIQNLCSHFLKEPKETGEKGKEKVIHSKHLRLFLKENGIEETTSREKQVPSCILRSTKETIQSFLKTLFSCEGHVKKGRPCELYSASEKLVSQVQNLLLKFNIISSKQTKEVNEEVYYRLRISGNDAKKFHENIGFIRSDQKEALDTKKIGGNVNHDTVPNKIAKRIAQKIQSDLRSSLEVGLSHDQSGIDDSVRTTLSNTIYKERGLSFEKIEEVLKIYEEIVSEGTKSQELLSLLRQLSEGNIYFDQVEEIERQKSEVMDIEIDHPTHTYIGNGFYNHNTIIAIGYIKDLRRKGILKDESDKVLVVAPSSLQGNIEGEAQAFLERPEEVTQHLEFMTYGSLSRQGSINSDDSLEKQWEDAQKDAIIKNYEAILCDEASMLKSRTSQRSLHLQVEHPRKVLLTASAIEKDPKELYNLYAITENENMHTPDGLKKRRQFQKNYSEKIGTRVVGRTEDPTQKMNLVDWMSQNTFFIDKQEMEEVDLPSKQDQSVGVSMDSEIEEAYREVSEKIEEVLRRMVALYRDHDEDAYHPKVTGAQVQLAEEFQKLDKLSNHPEEVLPGVEENPKIERSLDLIKEDIDGRTRTLMWTDDTRFAEKTARELSEKLPGQACAYGTPDEIGVYKNGNEVANFTQRVYEDPETGERVDPDQWRTHVVDNYIKPERDGVKVFVLTQSYSKGFNLQEFSKVIHLDRDDWKAENMKQRTARSWRQGQETQVENFHLDMTYSEPKDEYDQTLDEIRKHMQEMEEDLFQEFIKQTHKEKAGEVWFGMKQEPAELYDAQRDLVELKASPYVENHAEQRREDREESS